MPHPALHTSGQMTIPLKSKSQCLKASVKSYFRITVSFLIYRRRGYFCDYNCGNILTREPLKTEAVRFPKRKVEIVLHGVKFQKTSIIDTAVKTSQKAVFFEP
jgi:hypothetical protein